MSDRDQSPGAGGGNPDDQPKSEHLNIKVTDNNNEVFFKIKRTTALSKLMNAFCERQGKAPSSVRFLFDGARVNPTDSPDSVSTSTSHRTLHFHGGCFFSFTVTVQLLTLLLRSSRWPMEIHWKCTRNRLVGLEMARGTVGPGRRAV